MNDLPSAFDALRGAVHRYWVPTAPEEVMRRLDRHPHLQGDTGPERLDLTFTRSNSRNSWRPRIRGTMQSAAGGTLVEVTYPLNLFVAVFTFVHGLALLGISWVIGFLAYRWDLLHGRQLFEDALGATHVQAAALEMAALHDVANPRSPGAAADAPLSFDVRTSTTDAVFTLRGADRTLRLTVSQRGIELRGRQLSWDQLLDVDAAAGVLSLATATDPLLVSIEEHPAADQAWLVDYLRARDERWTSSADERDESLRAQQQLAGLRADSTRQDGDGRAG